jgi:hypothetical protein
MTPILNGRWQTRIFLLGTLGVIVTAIFAFAYEDDTFWYVLGYVILFGLGWDILYFGLQQFKWDRDWPPFAQWLAGAWEGLFIYLLIDNFGLPGIDEGTVPLERFIYHYGSVWAITWIASQGPMRALFPFWRFHGGRII